MHDNDHIGRKDSGNEGLSAALRGLEWAWNGMRQAVRDGNNELAEGVSEINENIRAANLRVSALFKNTAATSRPLNPITIVATAAVAVGFGAFFYDTYSMRRSKTSHVEHLEAERLGVTRGPNLHR